MRQHTLQMIKKSIQADVCIVIWKYLNKKNKKNLHITLHRNLFDDAFQPNIQFIDFACG